MPRDILTPEEKAKYQRSTLLASLCGLGFVISLEFFAEGEYRQLAIVVALAFWGVAAITLLLTAPGFLKKIFDRNFPRR